ncbi:MAG: amidohydrolase, partial [Streptosporangiaceae bacterium]
MGSAERPQRTAVTNVRVFDGRQLLPLGTVVIEAGRIGRDGVASEVIDGEGGVLLPGLIDAHVHLHDRHTLEQLAGFGVTTAFDMACAPPELVDSLRAVPGLTDIRSAGTPAVAPGSLHSRIPGTGQRGLIGGPDQAARFVADRIAEGSDYIKIIVGNPGLSHDQATLDALTAAAREHNKLTVAHASSYLAVQLAQRARVNVLTHVPLDQALDEAAAATAIADGRILIPTLAMMEGVVAQSAPPGADYAAARQSV